MADDGLACSFSVEEIKSLTIPRLKSELTKLNQPIGNLKRKPQLIAALTACIEQKQQGQHETKVPDEGDAEEKANEVPCEFQPVSGPERASSERPGPERESPAEKPGGKLDSTHSKSNAPGKEASTDDDRARDKQAKELVPVDPSKPQLDAKSVAAGTEVEHGSSSRTTGDQKESKLKSDDDPSVGAVDAISHGVKEPPVTKDEAPKSVAARGRELPGKSQSDKTRTPSKSESTPLGASTPAGSPMEVDDVEGNRAEGAEGSASSTSRSKTHRKSRKRANKGVGDEGPSTAEEAGKGGRDAREDGRGAEEGNGGGDDVGDTPEPKSKRSRKSSLPGKGSTKTKEPGSTKDREGQQKASSSKKSASVAQEPLKEGDVVADSGHHNGSVTEEGAGDDGSAQEGNTLGEAHPMDEDSNDRQKDESKKDAEMEDGGESAAPSFEGCRTGAETSASDPVAENPTERAVTSKLDAADPANASAPAAPAVAADDASSKEAVEVGDDANEKTEAGQELNPVTIRVDNFVRPFTAPQAKKLVEEKAGAPVLENGFWMDNIKTHCYATFDGEEAAKRAIEALQGLQWPERSSKRLAAKMGDVSAKEARARDDAKRAVRKLGAHPTAAVAAGVAAAAAAAAAVTGKQGARGMPGAGAVATGAASSAATGSGVRGAGSNGVNGNGKPSTSSDGVASPGVRGRGSVQAPGVERQTGREAQAANGDVKARDGQQDKEEDDEAFVLDKLFRKTTATPCLYWLPLSEQEVAERKKRMEAAGLGPRTTQMPAEHLATIGAGSRNGGGPWTGGDRRDYGSGTLSYSSRYGYRDQYYGRGAGGRRR